MDFQKAPKLTQALFEYPSSIFQRLLILLNFYENLEKILMVEIELINQHVLMNLTLYCVTPHVKLEGRQLQRNGLYLFENFNIKNLFNFE